MSPRLPRVIEWLLSRLVPAEWHDSVAGDLAEERARRRRQRRPAGPLWLTAAAVRVAAALAFDRRRAMVTNEHTSRRSWSMDGWRSDLRQALRGLLAHRLYAGIAVAILAIGIGANAAVFNLANWLLLRPLPGVARPAELVTMVATSTGSNRAYWPISFPDFQRLEQGLPALAGLAGYQSFSMHVAAPPASPRRVDAEVVTGGYFRVLGDPIALGRGFTADEGASPALAPAVVISDRLWRTDFGARLDIVGQQVMVNGHAMTVIGVATAGFHGVLLTGGTDLWAPIAQHALAIPMYSKTLLTNARSTVLFGLFGRIAPGETIERVAAQAEAVRAQMTAADTRYAKRTFAISPGTESRPWVREKLTTAMTLLMGLVSLLLVLTSANVGNLMLARAKQRESELATRLAIGASRGRIARLLLTESLILSLCAGLVALALAMAVAGALEGSVVLQGVPAMTRAAIDWRVFAFAMGVSMAISVIAGLIPALAGTRLDVATMLRAVGRTQTGARRRLRQTLTAAQIAVSLTLLVGGLLLARSMFARLSTNVGFDTRGVLSFSIEPGLQGYGPRQENFYRQLIDRVRETPGVRSAGLAWLQPYSQGAADTRFKIADAPAGEDGFSADLNMVSPGFFAALNLPLLDGRDFTDAEFQRPDDQGGGVVILTESLARRAFGTANAAGRRVTMASPEGRVRTVVGVVSDTRLRRANDPDTDMLFEPFGQTFPSGWASMLVRFDGSESEIVPRLRRTVAAIDPTLPIYDVIRLNDALARQFADDILIARLTTVFAAIATLIAAVGLYGILARGVVERHREFGIRAALGAAPARVARLVAAEALRVLAIGLAAGVALSIALSRLIAARLTGVTAGDPGSYALAAGVLVVVTLIAALPAARRAARIGAIGVLR